MHMPMHVSIDMRNLDGCILTGMHAFVCVQMCADMCTGMCID